MSGIKGTIELKIDYDEVEREFQTAVNSSILNTAESLKSFVKSGHSNMEYGDFFF